VDAERLAQTFVELADCLVDEFELHELLDTLVRRCIELLGVASVGLLLTDDNGGLRIAATSSNRAQMLELFQLQNHEGPCLDALAAGAPVVVADCAAERERWPRFSRLAAAEGMVSVLALPMRARGRVIGALNLFGGSHRLATDPRTVLVAQALADVATITLMQQRVHHERDAVTEQLRTALQTRVVIEQAKGALSATLGVDPAQAFEILRRRARDSRRRLVELAEEIVDEQTRRAQVRGSSGEQTPHSAHNDAPPAQRPGRPH
jgi:transcriptional regulator with GAF, ATPase, and Fis domain